MQLDLVTLRKLMISDQKDRNMELGTILVRNSRNDRRLGRILILLRQKHKQMKGLRIALNTTQMRKSRKVSQITKLTLHQQEAGNENIAVNTIPTMRIIFLKVGQVTRVTHPPYHTEARDQNITTHTLQLKTMSTTKVSRHLEATHHPNHSEARDQNTMIHTLPPKTTNTTKVSRRLEVTHHPNHPEARIEDTLQIRTQATEVNPVLAHRNSTKAKNRQNMVLDAIPVSMNPEEVEVSQPIPATPHPHLHLIEAISAHESEM
jgi:hypothetical protein